MGSCGQPEALTEAREMNLNVGGSFQRCEFVHQRIRSLFQEHTPGTEDSEHRDANQQEHPDRHFANSEPQPDDIRLVYEVEAVRIEPDQSEQFGGSLE